MPLPRFSTLSAAKRQLCIDLFCERRRYPATVEGPNDTQIPNPETKAQFVTRLAEEWIVQQALEQHRVNTARTVDTAFDS